MACKRCIAVAVGAVMLAITMQPAVAAGEIRIKVGDCKNGTEVVARDAPLAEVLERLSDSLGFKLHLEAPLERNVNVQMTAAGPDLIAALAAEERVMISRTRDPRCAGQSRVARVWVLPKGEPVVAAPVAKPTPVTAVASRDEMRSHDARSRALKDEYDAYVKKHGKPPPGEEQEEAKP